MVQFITFLLFTGLVGFISWRWTHRDDHASATGYFLAGRSLPWIVVAGSLLLTNLSTEQLVGLNGGAFTNGMQVMAWEVWSSIAIVLMATMCALAALSISRLRPSHTAAAAHSDVVVSTV